MSCVTTGHNMGSHLEALAGILAGLALLGEEHGVDVGEHTTGGDGHAAEQLVELLVVADGQLDVAGHDAVLLVVAGGVAGELKDLGAQVLEDGGGVDGGTGTDGLGVAALLDVAGDTAHGELEAGLGAAGDGLAALATLACWFLAGHV